MESKFCDHITKFDSSQTPRRHSKTKLKICLETRFTVVKDVLTGKDDADETMEMVRSTDTNEVVAGDGIPDDAFCCSCQE